MILKPFVSVQKDITRFFSPLFVLKIKEGKKKKIPENEQKIVSSTGLDLA